MNKIVDIKEDEDNYYIESEETVIIQRKATKTASEDPIIDQEKIIVDLCDYATRKK